MKPEKIFCVCARLNQMMVTSVREELKIFLNLQVTPIPLTLTPLIFPLIYSVDLIHYSNPSNMELSFSTIILSEPLM